MPFYKSYLRHPPSAEEWFSTLKKGSYSTTSCDRPPKIKSYPGCLGQVVSGMVYSVVAN